MKIRLIVINNNFFIKENFINFGNFSKISKDLLIKISETIIEVQIANKDFIIKLLGYFLNIRDYFLIVFLKLL